MTNEAGKEILAELEEKASLIYSTDLQSKVN